MDDSFGSDELDEEQKDEKSSEFARLLEASFKKPQKKLSVGDKIRGEILVIGKEDVFVSTGRVGTMTDGAVPKRELLDSDGKFNFKIGDELDLFVVQVRGSEVFLSTRATAKNLADDLEDAYDMMLPIEGRVTEVCKGGVRVSVHGKPAFCPISQLDLARVENAEDYVGKRYQFKITQFSEGGRNIVVSRRKVLEEERGFAEEGFVDQYQTGQIVSGTVKRIESFGAFVEITPGVEGLLHISELSWSRVAHPSEVIVVGQEIGVKILKCETNEGRLKISLSLKQAGPEPWKNLPPEVKEGHVVKGQVTRCMKFGAFVEIAPGLEGLIPLSEMSYTKRVVRSDELIKEGEEILVMIKEILPEAKRISLSLKDAGFDPWAMVPQKFPVGAIVSGKVERRESYGLFVQLEDGVTGLLPKSKALERAEFPFEKLRLGDGVVVQIADVRMEERRISLEVPQDANRDDWKGYTAKQPSSGSFGTLGEQFKKAFEKKRG